MKIGLFSDGLADLSFAELLATASELGLDALEFGCGNWSKAPHLDLARMLDSEPARREFKAALADHGLAISALNCSGNPLHPGAEGRAHDRVTRDTIRLASLMGVDRVVLMSGLPGAPGDRHPNWITVAWPPETGEILRWQWDEVVIPYWRDLVAYAGNLGIKKLCLELHGFQAVYSARTLLKLRAAVGDVVGANLDPSHLMWMGADPLAAARALGGAIHYVHAKDTRLHPVHAAENGVLETAASERIGERAWSYVTLGYGHDEAWWAQFCSELALAGYDGVLSIEHEDPRMPALDGIKKSVDLLDRVVLNRPARS